jgi:hypothetical protein
VAVGFKGSLCVLVDEFQGGEETHLVVDALVEEHTERPPVDLARVALALVHLGREIGERARLAGQRLVGGEVGRDVLSLSAELG